MNGVECVWKRRETCQLTEFLPGGEEMDGFNVSLATFMLPTEGWNSAWESESEATSSDSCKTCNLQRKQKKTQIKSLEQK